jgi:hypothetical protein
MAPSVLRLFLFPCERMELPVMTLVEGATLARVTEPDESDPSGDGDAWSFVLGIRLCASKHSAQRKQACCWTDGAHARHQ